jgi:hypothetical protein
MTNVSNEPSDVHIKLPQGGTHGRNHWENHGEDTRHS